MDMIFRNREMPGKILLGISLLILVVIVRLPSVKIPFDNDSGAVAYSARLITQGEPLYGSHHTGHHLPAAYYTYAAVFAVFGDKSEGIKIFLIGWVWINALFVYSIGNQLSNRLAGVLAAVFFVLVTSISMLSGDSGEIELFANLPLTVVCWLSIRTIKKSQKPATYLLIGVFSALGFLYKAVYLTSLPAVIAMLFVEAAFERRPKEWLKFLKRCSWILIGFLLVAGLTFGYFAAIGLGQRFLLVFQMGMGYINGSDRPDLFTSMFNSLVILCIANVVMVIVGVFSAVRALIILPKTFSSNRQQGLSILMLEVWLFATLIVTAVSGLAASHYDLLLLPPFSLLAGIEIGNLWVRIAPSGTHTRFGGRAWLPVLMASAIVANSLYVSGKYYLGYLNYLIGQSTLTEFVRNNVYFGTTNIEAVEIAQYIDQRTSPEERILTLTTQAQICYLANRRSSSDVLWFEYVPLLGKPQRIFDTKPAYVILDAYALFATAQGMPDWLSQELTLSYRLVKTTGINEIYERIAP